MYRNVSLLYSSGTGNSYRVAEWMKEKVVSSSINAVISSLEESKVTAFPGGRQSLLLLVFPTHGFTAPWHIIKFILKLRRGRGTQVAVAATRAGLKFGPVFLPGVAGSAFLLISLLLFFKGYNLRGAASFDMPSNWISLHSGLKKQTAEAIKARTRPLVDSFVGRILSGKRHWFTLNVLYEFLWTLLVYWISILYLLLGRIFLAKIFFASNRCNQCGLCESSCPVKAVKLRGNPKRPYWTINCESCMRCMCFCPHRAIEVSHPWLLLLSLLMYVPFALYLSNLFLPVWDISVFTMSWYGQWIVSITFTALIICSGYLLFYWITRIPAVNTLLTYTTGTHYYRRYHEPETSLKLLIMGSTPERDS